MPDSLNRLKRLGWLALVLAGLTGLRGEAQEFRAFWVDAFHDGFKTGDQVTKLVGDLRAANCNAVAVEVRKRGDSYYNSRFEPRATDIASTFDPLQDLIAKAHDTNAGPRIEIHAWIVTYPIWGSQTTPPSQPDHAYNLHPDWLTRDRAGTNWAGSYYVFDPGHPGVQQHTFNVAMDLITNYDVDGLNFDYIRYPGYEWGYNPVAVARFNARYGRTGQPAQQDAAWMQWRREQVTALLRKVYLSALAVKPLVKISADTIGGTPGPTSDLDWTNRSQAYTLRLQDWRGWMQEGILDLNIAMVYFRQENPTYATDYLNWNQFIKDRRYGRHAVIGPGIYLNSISNGLYQMRVARQTTPSGNWADGICGYSYAVPASNVMANLQATFLAALTQPSAYDPLTPAIFAEPATVPPMLWKLAPTNGHLKGAVVISTNGAAADGAAIVIAGPVNRALLSDATGFYGAVDLPPGDYTLSVSLAGFQTDAAQFKVVAGNVTNVNLTLYPSNYFAFDNLAVTPGARAALVSWTTAEPTATQVEITAPARSRTPLMSEPVTQHVALVAGLEPGQSYTAQALARIGTNEFRSGEVSFRTAGTIDLDNPDAVYSGAWAANTSAMDKYLTNYYYATSVSGAATRTATFAPDLPAPGYYDVYVWYPQGSNRSANAPHTIVYDGGSLATNVNQTANGGGWRLLAAGLRFAKGTNGYLQIANNSGETSKVILADGARFDYSPGQEPPAGMTAPLWWTGFFFGASVNPLADPDGDGYPTWMEFLLGTSPISAASRLEFGINQEASAVFMPCLPGRVYSLEQTTNLMQGSWVPSGVTITLSTNGVGTVALPATNGPQTYYRLKVGW
jgi:uncharacterized lipoprotein YddW (UPF0748 family)